MDNKLKSKEMCDCHVKSIYEINNLILSYGFYVDNCDHESVANLWLDDGEYIVNGVGRWVGRDQLKDMVKSDMHREYVSSGCMHFMGSPEVVVKDMDAYAKSNTLLIKCDAEGFIIDRVSHNFWHFQRTSDGWRVKLRENTLVSKNN